jgi:hypothetical protein
MMGQHEGYRLADEEESTSRRDARLRRANGGSSTKSSPIEAIDWVTLLAVFSLLVIACVSLWIGDNTVAGTAVGAIAGLVMRLYR